MVSVEFLLFWLQTHLLELLGLALGFLLIPTISFFGPHPFIAEPVARIQFALGQLFYQLQYRGAKLYQRADRSYEIRPLTDDDGPLAHTTRLGGGLFGIDYDRDPGLFGDAAERLEPGERPSQARDHTLAEAVRADGGDDGQAVRDDLRGMHPCAISRGGVRTFWDPDQEKEDPQLVVNLAAALSSMKNAAGLDIGNTALRRSLPEYGGDQGGVSTTKMLIAMFVFLVLGVGVGVILIA